MFVLSQIIKIDLGKCNEPWPAARLTTLTSTLIIPDITKNLIQSLFIISI